MVQKYRSFSLPAPSKGLNSCGNWLSTWIHRDGTNHIGGLVARVLLDQIAEWPFPQQQLHQARVAVLASANASESQDHGVVIPIAQGRSGEVLQGRGSQLAIGPPQQHRCE